MATGMRAELLIGLSSIAVLVAPVAVVQAQSVEELFRQSIAAQRAGDYGQVERIWRQILRLDPDDFGAYNNLGNALTDQGRWAEAEAIYREAIRLAPNEAIPYNNLGVVLMEQGRLVEAEAAYREAIRIAPHIDLAYNNLGNALSAQGKFTEAEAAYRRSILEGRGSFFSNAYAGLGNLLVSQERYEETIDLYQQFLRIHPTSTWAQNNLAEAQRLLALRTAPFPTRSEDLAWQPNNERLLPVLRAVVRVVTATPTGAEIGTGFVVRREGSKIWVLTNRHVVTSVGAGLDSDPGTDQRAQRQAGALSETIAVDFYSEPPEGRIWLRLPATVVESTGPQDELDLALLVVDNAPNDIHPLELASTAVGLDTNVRIIGHHHNPWGLARGYISERPQGAELQLAGASIGRRSSGSPILNEQNQVVGIVTDIEPPNVRAGNDFLSGFSYGHPSFTLLETLTLWGMD